MSRCIGCTSGRKGRYLEGAYCSKCMRGLVESAHFEGKSDEAIASEFHPMTVRTVRGLLREVRTVPAEVMQ